MGSQQYLLKVLPVLGSDAMLKALTCIALNLKKLVEYRDQEYQELLYDKQKGLFSISNETGSSKTESNDEDNIIGIQSLNDQLSRLSDKDKAQLISMVPDMQSIAEALRTLSRSPVKTGIWKAEIENLADKLENLSKFRK